MYIIKRIVSLLAWLSMISVVVSANTNAYEKDFPPYPKGQFPPTCKIHTLKVNSETDRNKGHFKSAYRLSDEAEKLVLHLDMNYQKNSSGMYVKLNSASGETYVKPVKIGGHPSNIDKVFWAYLNKDNRKDIIITMKDGDGYLSAGRQGATFLLSNENASTGYSREYGVQQLAVHSLGQQDFYDYSTDKKCEYLHQALVSDGKQSYMTYNVLQFIDGKIVIKNQLSRYFPKWILLTAQPNSKASVLTKAQIKKLSYAYYLQIGHASR